MSENLNSDKDKKGAAVKFPPPLIFLLMMLFAYGINYYYPINIGVSSKIKYLGWFLVVSSICLVIYISRLFARIETHIEPWKPTTAIISTGIYAYSRNPIYVAFCLIAIGVGIIVNSFWVLFSFLPSAALVYFIAIKKEEDYLQNKFGEEYFQYKNSVRRWL